MAFRMTGDSRVVAVPLAGEKSLWLFSSQRGQMLDLNIVVNALSMRHTKQASSNKQTSAFHFITLSLRIVIGC